MFKVLLRDSSKGCLRGGTPSLWGFLNTIMTCYKYKACWSNSQNCDARLRDRLWERNGELQCSDLRVIAVLLTLSRGAFEFWQLRKLCKCHRSRWIAKQPVAIKLVFARLFGFATSKEVFFRKIIRFSGKSLQRLHIKTTMQILMTYTVTVILL